MDYFCYISQSKVDQLHDSLTDGRVESWSEEAGRQAEQKAAGGVSGIWSVLKADISYGRQDTFKRQAHVKQTYVNKIKTVLAAVSSATVEFDWSVVASEGMTFYWYNAEFRVANINQQHKMVELLTDGEQGELRLHCSFKYFSDNPDGESLHITSTNYAFFEEQLPIELESVFFLTNNNEQRFLGSPLYLKLAPIPGVIL